MAMTATIASVPASAAKIGQEINYALTISNSGGATVNVNVIDPLVYVTGAPVGSIACSSYAIQNSISGAAGPKVVLPVAASGSIVVNFTVKIFAAGSYSVGAVCYSDDGSVFSPTAATMAITVVS